MYNDDYDRSGDEIYSKPVRAGKRTYFFDVKSTKGNNDFYLTITESKRKIEQDGRYVYDKHKIFLYKEDFDRFVNVLKQVMDYANEYQPNRAQQANKVVEKPNDIDDRLSISIDDFDLESGDKPSE